ncbi:hypothetical protein NPX13_g11089 [Xylaria arbuscula]|uniref:Uncharacterized protein n=1 Tax=Xylaria arbuscula TaxID=114810 RepID=A0A9W8TH96_9PEZI|nr:hypothetical protein NPX13_g11089 [Xylaria arbuscula]
MAEIEQDIGADLDRIADICARSRYSLSNQYEIHVAPHGSGASYAQEGTAAEAVDPSTHDHSGPTLQAISIDEEHSSANNGRRVLVRRRSAAYGTLETIASSSRSSDSDRSKRKSAAEIAAQVRGRVQHPSVEGAGAAYDTEFGPSRDPHGEQTNQSSRARPTLAAAIFGHSRAQNYYHPQTPRTSNTDLVAEPAVPETSHSHLVSTTATEGKSSEDRGIGLSVKEQVSVSVSNSVAAAAISAPEDPKDQPSLLGGFRFGIPWIGSSSMNLASTAQKPNSGTKSYAEGTLRHLLGITESSSSRGGKSANEEDGAAG